MVFSFSKIVYHFSDLAWLEKISYLEPKTFSLNASGLFYSSMKNSPLVKQLIVISIVLVLLICL
jgi:hypothetical protein